MLSTQVLIKGSSYEAYFSEATEGSVQQKLYKETVEGNKAAFAVGYDDTEEKITEEVNGKDGVAYLGDFEAEISLKKLPCYITKATPMGSTLEHTGLPFRKESPYLPLFNNILHEFRVSGCLDRVFFDNPIFQKPSLKFCPNRAKFEQIGYSQSFTAFLFVYIGVVLSTALLFAEKLYKANKAKCLEKWNDPNSSRPPTTSSVGIQLIEVKEKMS